MAAAQHARSTQIVTDLSAWPLALVTMPAASPTDLDVRQCIEDQRAILAQRERHVLLCDARYAVAMPATQRKLWADWLAEAEPLNRRYTVAMAVVLSSPLVRGALTAVTWLRRPAVELKVVGTMAEGVDQLLAALRFDGAPGLDAALAQRDRIARL